MKNLRIFRWSALILLAPTCLVLLMLPLPASAEGSLTHAFFNTLHFPLFAGIYFLLVAVLRRGLLVPLAAGIALSLVGEWIQPRFGRTASWLDFGYSVLGMLFVLAGLKAFRGYARRLRWAGAAAGLLAMGLLPLAGLAADRYLIGQRFPVLADFSLPWEALRLQGRGAELERVPGEGGGHRLAVRRSDPNEQFVGLTLLRMPSDWSSARELIIEIENPQSRPVSAEVRIDDSRDVQPSYAERFQQSFRLEPGRTNLRMDARTFGLTSGGAPLDLERIARMVVFFPDIQLGETVFIDRILLTLTEEATLP